MVASVRVLTFCRGREFLYGNLLVLDSIRTGFPTANIEIWDNASEQSCVEEIEKKCKGLNVPFFRYYERVEHADWMDEMLAAAPDDAPLVFVDPDVVFWKNVEDWVFPEGTAMAGRYVPRVRLFREAPTDARLHTSLLWIMRPGDARALGQKEYLYDFRPFHGSIFRDTDGHFRHIDTAGALYSVWKEWAHAFTEEQLDCYDHIWSGTAADFNDNTCTPEVLAVMHDTHAMARSNPEHLKGLWKTQEALIKRITVPEGPTAVEMQKPTVYSRPSEAEMHLRWANNNQDAAALIGFFGHATQLADDLVDLDRDWAKTKRGRSQMVSDLLFTLLIKIPGNPFFRANEIFFPPLFVNCLTTWEASNEWARGTKKETRMFAYVMREAAGRLVESVAYLTGGFEWSKLVAREVHDYYHVHGGEKSIVESFASWEAEVLA